MQKPTPVEPPKVVVPDVVLHCAFSTVPSHVPVAVNVGVNLAAARFPDDCSDFSVESCKSITVDVAPALWLIDTVRNAIYVPVALSVIVNVVISIYDVEVYGWSAAFTTLVIF